MKKFLGAELEFTPIDKSYFKVLLITEVLIHSVIFLVLLGVFALFSGKFSASNIVFGSLLALTPVSLCLFVWLAYRKVKVMGYVLQETELIIREGIMFQSLTVIPYGRMQQVQISVGPLLKKFDLSTVELITASADTEATISGLKREVAENLRVRLTELGNSQMEGL